MLRAPKKTLNPKPQIECWERNLLLRGGTDDNWDLLKMRRLLNPKPSLKLLLKAKG
jgi:hypothetical protein